MQGATINFSISGLLFYLVLCVFIVEAASSNISIFLLQYSEHGNFLCTILLIFFSTISKMSLLLFYKRKNNMHGINKITGFARVVYIIMDLMCVGL